MNERVPKSVLVVDDHLNSSLSYRFERLNDDESFPYIFSVKTANSAAEAIAQIRSMASEGGYDVIILDVRMHQDIMSGLKVNSALALAEQCGDSKAVRIVYTGYDTLSECVLAMRCGAWDYVPKGEIDGEPADEVVVRSAVHRLRSIDSRREQEDRIGSDWLPGHFQELRTKYFGKIVALWSDQDVNVIAVGRDAFELAENLQSWRKDHKFWEEPYLIRFGPGLVEGSEGG